MVLENIDGVAWAGLTHAYGSAADVPALIRALASTDKVTRDNAYNELHGNIWHQGTVYEATSYAVPFLLELLAEDQTEDKSSLLLLLASLATGSSYHEVHGPLRLFDGKRDTPEFKKKLAFEREWVRYTLQAVRCGIPLFVAHLPHANHEVRSSAAHLLGQCKEDAVAAHLVQRLDVETEPSVVASIIFALSDLRQGDPITIPSYLDHADFGVRFAAAVCTAKSASGIVPSKAINLLADVEIDYHLLDAYESLPYAIFNPLTSVAANMLAALGTEKAGFVVPRLMESLPAIPSYALDEPIDALMGLTFHRSASPLIRENLTDLQLAVLNVLVRTESVWQYSFQLIRANQLEKYGLPVNQAALREFLRR